MRVRCNTEIHFPSLHSMQSVQCRVKFDNGFRCARFYVELKSTRFYSVLSWLYQDTPWRSCLRHCATSGKVAGSIPDGVTGIFRWYNPSGRTMALGSTQALTEMRGKGGRCLGLINLPPSCPSNSWNTQGLYRLLYFCPYVGFHWTVI